MADAVVNTARAGIRNIAGTVVGRDGMDLVERAILAESNAVERSVSLAVRQDLKKMKKEYGRGAATLVSITNATGADMRLVRIVNYHGHVGRHPPPVSIRPGQVGHFLHVKTKGGLRGSKAGLVYRVKNSKGRERDVFLGFDTGFTRKDRLALVRSEDAGYWDRSKETDGGVDKEDEDKESSDQTTKLLSNGNGEQETSGSTEDMRKLIKNEGVTDYTSHESFDIHLKVTLEQRYRPICRFFVGYRSSQTPHQ